MRQEPSALFTTRRKPSALFAARGRAAALLFSSALLLASCAGGPASNAPGGGDGTAASNSAPTAAATPFRTQDIVSIEVSRADLRRGARAQVELRLKIKEGFHVNANPASEEFLIPTEVRVASELGVGVFKTDYPAGVTKKFSFSEKPLAVYEGEARVVLTLEAAADAPGGGRTLRARVRVQPCDDEKCFPPDTIETVIPVHLS